VVTPISEKRVQLSINRHFTQNGGAGGFERYRLWLLKKSRSRKIVEILGIGNV